MPKRTPSLETRLDTLEATIANLRAELAELGASTEELASMRDDVEELRRELAMRRKRNPELPPELRATRAQNAALARASKGVGRGQDKVSSPAMKKKLLAEARGPAPKRKTKRS